MLVFERRARDGQRVVVACNFTPVVREHWRIGVPAAGTWHELINTDFGGVLGLGRRQSAAAPASRCHGKARRSR